MAYLVTNFAYGTGPYLRTTELALAFNDYLEARGHERLRIIVPLVYGEKQRRVMFEEFHDAYAHRPREIVFDPELGALLREIFYTGHAPYEETLQKWIASAFEVGRRAHTHLSGTFDVELVDGSRETVKGSEIVLEINRSPRIRYDVAPAYSTTFGYVADILERAASLPHGVCATDSALLRQGAALADRIEGVQDMHVMAYPATFSWRAQGTPRYRDELLVPPLTSLPQPYESDLDEGIFVTVTGIEGLERLYREAHELGLSLYSNDTDAVSGSRHALPHIVPSRSLAFQFARAGWGSIWLSMYSGTPLVVPSYDPSDDPEIYFNTVAVEALGIGHVYRGEQLSDILARRDELRSACGRMVADIEGRWGVRGGNEVAARAMVDRFLGTSV